MMNFSAYKYSRIDVVENDLTILVLAEMIVGGLAGLAGARFVMSPNPELVNHPLLQTFDLRLRSGVGGFRYLHPVDSELVLHLHRVMSDRSTAVVLRLLPLEGYANVVVVEDHGFARLVRLVCGGAKVRMKWIRKKTIVIIP